MGSVFMDALKSVTDLVGQNLKDVAKSLEPLAKQTAADFTTAGAQQVDKLLISLESGARGQTMSRGQLDQAMQVSQLGMPLVKKILPAALKLAAKNNHSSQQLTKAADDLMKTANAFTKEYKEMRAQEDYQGTGTLDNWKDKLLETKEQSDALGQLLKVTEKWENLKVTMNKHCGLNLDVGATSSLGNNYHRFAGLTFPK